MPAGQVFTHGSSFFARSGSSNFSLSYNAPEGQTSTQARQNLQPESLSGALHPVPTTVFIPRFTRPIAPVLRTSRHILTQRPHKIHLSRSRTKNGSSNAGRIFAGFGTDPGSRSLRPIQSATFRNCDAF